VRGAVRMRDESLRVAGVQIESKRTSLALACLPATSPSPSDGDIREAELC
jgi:hypothetical protein